jgi:hypothetical protein
MTMSKLRLPQRPWLISPALALLLSGCAGVGSYMHDTFSRNSNPNAAAASETLNMQRVQGKNVAVAPIAPMPGDVWPGPLQPVPTLSEIQKNMNVPLSEEYNQRYGVQQNNAFTGTMNQGTAIEGAGALPPAPPASYPPPSGGQFPVGQTLIAPTGPAGIVTSGSNGRYQTVAPINGQGGGILTPNGNGTATLQGPNGQITTVPAPGNQP